MNTICEACGRPSCVLVKVGWVWYCGWCFIDYKAARHAKLREAAWLKRTGTTKAEWRARQANG
ncbi:MAG TPA: hypothetical protein VGE45_00425 [Chloroflexia bacterium]|jgi:hypothetical protein